MIKQPRHVPMVIVGGGISGLYAAMRLRESQTIDGPIMLIEASPRTGGRVRTLVAGEAAPEGNVGAMRFLPSQWAINGLIEKCGLSDDLLPHTFSTAHYFLRGRQWKPAELNASKHLERFDLSTGEQGLEPGILVINAILMTLHEISIDSNDAYQLKIGDRSPTNHIKGGLNGLRSRLRAIDPNNPSMARMTIFSADEWDVIKRHGKFRDTPLYRLSLLDILHQHYGPEAVSFIHDGLGYHSIIGIWNASEAMPWFLNDFSATGYLTVSGGMERLCDSVEHAWMDAAQQQDQHDLVLCDSRVYDIMVRRPELPGPRFEVSYGPNKDESVTCDKIILAVCPRAIEGIGFRRADEDEQEWIELDESVSILRSGSASIQGHPLLKAFIWFESAWWTKEPFGLPLRCKCFSDTPLRQIYFCGARSQDAEEPALAMMYCDSTGAQYWQSLIQTYNGHVPYFSTAFSEMLGNSAQDAKSKLKDVGISRAFADRLLTWMGHVLGQPLDLDSSGFLAGTAVDWAEAHTFAGWHSWAICTEPWACRDALWSPFGKIPLFLCNEACSPEQGWIEGSLRSTDRVLCMGLGLEPPPWANDEAAMEQLRVESYEQYVSI